MGPAQLPWPQGRARGFFLFSDNEIQEITDKKRKQGRYTLANLPEPKLNAILVLLKERRSFRDVTRLVGVAWETVQAVANKYAVEIQNAWETLPAAIGLTTRYLVYRLQDRIDSVPVHTIPQAVKNLVELKQLLEGQATSCVEHTVEPRRVSSLGEYEQQIGHLEKKTRARMVEEASGMHLPAEKSAGAGHPPGPPASSDPPTRIRPRICNPSLTGSQWGRHQLRLRANQMSLGNLTNDITRDATDFATEIGGRRH